MIDAGDGLVETKLGRLARGCLDGAFRGRADPLDLPRGKQARLGSVGEAKGGELDRKSVV